MTLTRRNLLAASALLPIAACSQSQIDAALAKLKSISASFTAFVTKYAGGLLPDVVAQIAANNAAIQALTGDNWMATAKVLVSSVVGAVLKLLPSLLPLIPGNVLGPFQIVLDFLKGFAGLTAAAQDGKPLPTIDQAEGAALALR